MNSLALLEGAPAWFIALLDLSLQAAILAAIVFVITKTLGRWIPPNWRSLLWFLVIARVLIPFSPPSPFSLQNLYIERPQEKPLLAKVQFLPAVESSGPPIEMPFTLSLTTPPANPPLQIGKIVMIAWAAIAASCLSILFIRYLAIRRHLSASRRHGEVFEPILSELKLWCPLRIESSDQIAAPALTGLIPARLIIPANFADLKLTTVEIRHILLHEIAHVRQGHLLLHWLTLIARSLHWFNPAILFAAAQLRRDCELAADQAALKNATPEERLAYGETLLKILRQTIAPPTSLALGMAEQARHLEQRLKELRTPSRHTFRILGAVFFITLSVSGMSSAKLKNPAQPIALDQAALRELYAAQVGNKVTHRQQFTARNTIANVRDAGVVGTNATGVTIPGSLAEARERLSKERLITRTYRLDPNAFHSAMEKAPPANPAVTADATLIQAEARAFFAAVGVDFPAIELGESTPRPAEKAFFFNDRAGVLYVRATLSELDAIESALHFLNMPGQVQPPVKVAAVSATNSAAAKAPQVELFTRTYKVNPHTIALNLQKNMRAAVANEADLKTNIFLSLRQFLSEAGVDFPTSQVSGQEEAATRKAIFYKDQTGVLFVRATMEDLERIETALPKLNITPPQISFQVRCSDMDVDLATSLLKAFPVARKITMTNEIIATLRKGSVTAEPTLRGNQELAKKLKVPIGSTVEVTEALEYILPNARIQEFLKAIENRSGIDLIAMPTVTTLVERQAVISIEESYTAVTEDTVVENNLVKVGAVQCEKGLRTWIDPQQVTDQQIKYSATFEGSDFLGYDERDKSIPLPRFRLCATTSSVSVPHDYSQLIVQRVPSNTNANRRTVLIMSPTVIDPAGNRVYGPK